MNDDMVDLTDAAQGRARTPVLELELPQETPVELWCRRQVAGEFVLVVDEPFTRHESWETASNFTEHRVSPGEYRLELTDIQYRQWLPDPTFIPAGRIANTGPYYGVAKVATHAVRDVWTDRLLGHSRRSERTLDEPSTITVTLYAYQIADGARIGDHFRIKRVA